jgi:hypothetical protein
VCLLSVAALALHPASVEAANPAPPFTECPAVGSDTSCAILIVIQIDGSLTILSDPTQGPIDRGDDTLIGVLNSSGITVPSIAVGSATQQVFGFEAPNDGLCSFPFAGNAYCTATPRPATGYEGPASAFSAISANKRDGTVRFTGPGGGLLAGATTFFSLETRIAASTFGTGSATALTLAASPVSTSDHGDSATVSATLKNGANPVANAPVTFTLAPGAGAVSCAATTSATGLASCALTPPQAAGAYQLVVSYAGSSVPFLAPINLGVPFTVTPEQDVLTYTGPSSGTAGQRLVLSSVLTTDDPAAATPVPGRGIVLTLGSGPSAVSCTAVSDATGSAACPVVVPAAEAGQLTATATFVSDGVFESAAATGIVGIPMPIPEVGSAHTVPSGAGTLLVVAGLGLAALAGRRRRRPA